MPLRLPPRGRL